jgi:hypothetical protein
MKTALIKIIAEMTRIFSERVPRTINQSLIFQEMGLKVVQDDDSSLQIMKW